MIKKLTLLLLIVMSGCYAQNDSEDIQVITKQVINSKFLHDTRILYVSLPESYNKTTDDFPVLYLLDGDFMPAIYEAIAASQYLHFFNDTPEFIIVGIATTKNRDKYFVPDNEFDSKQDDVTNFQSYLLDEVIPFIESAYRANDFKILFGASNGGLFSLYTAMTAPDIFQGIISSSPSIGLCPDLMHRYATDFRQRKLKSTPRIYLNYGEQDKKNSADYTPLFYDQIVRGLPSDHPIKLEVIAEQGHVPFGSIFNGLKYALNKHDNEQNFVMKTISGEI